MFNLCGSKDSHFDKICRNIVATFSQFFFVGQKIKHELSGIISETNPVI